MFVKTDKNEPAYTCDYCYTLLWIGPEESKNNPRKRIYCFDTNKGEVYETNKSGRFKFCKTCGLRQPSTRRRELVW